MNSSKSSGALCAALLTLVISSPTEAHVLLETPQAPARSLPHATPATGSSILLAAADSAPEATVVKAGSLEIIAPWLRATPGGAKVAGGYLSITNTGTEPDRLIGAAIPVAQRGDIHEMSMANGMMRMRALESGLEIKPGQTVELKPGGYHIMFEDLREPLKQGDTIEGTLTFAKAGTVNITFQVGGIADTRAPEHMQHMH